MASINLLEAVQRNLELVTSFIKPVEGSQSRGRSKGRGGTRKKATGENNTEVSETPDVITLANALTALQAAVSDLAGVVRSNSDAHPAVASAGEPRIRESEDELDDEKQKNLKGKFFISSSDKDGKESLFKSDDALKADNKDLVDHVMDLALQKYEVKIPKQDFASCHRVYNGGIIFHLWNQRPGAAYNNLCKNIKSRKNLNLNIYFNFMLTKRRSTLLFEARKLKKQFKITKILSDEHGSITIKKDDIKDKIASYVDKNTGKVVTWTVEELLLKYDSPVTE